MEDPGQPGSSEPDRHLPRGIRLALFAVGGFFLLVGLVGLALPIVPQAIPLALAAATLSLASDRVYRWLSTLFRRWPRAWKIVQATRHRLHGWLARGKPSRPGKS